MKTVSYKLESNKGGINGNLWKHALCLLLLSLFFIVLLDQINNNIELDLIQLK